jgi:hemoglobin-like flavoprotein
MDLFSQLQSSLAGENVAKNAINNGLIPNASQPRGSQQLWIAAIAATRSEISNLNKLADSLRRVGEEQCDREVTACTHKLQGVLDKLKSKMSDMQNNAT